jgi:hypothetical protein
MARSSAEAAAAVIGVTPFRIPGGRSALPAVVLNTAASNAAVAAVSIAAWITASAADAEY